MQMHGLCCDHYCKRRKTRVFKSPLNVRDLAHNWEAAETGAQVPFRRFPSGVSSITSQPRMPSETAYNSRYALNHKSPIDGGSVKSRTTNFTAYSHSTFPHTPQSTSYRGEHFHFKSDFTSGLYAKDSCHSSLPYSHIVSPCSKDSSVGRITIPDAFLHEDDRGSSDTLRGNRFHIHPQERRTPLCRNDLLEVLVGQSAVEKGIERTAPDKIRSSPLYCLEKESFGFMNSSPYSTMKKSPYSTLKNYPSPMAPEPLLSKKYKPTLEKIHNMGALHPVHSQFSRYNVNAVYPSRHSEVIGKSTGTVIQLHDTSFNEDDASLDGRTTRTSVFRRRRVSAFVKNMMRRFGDETSMLE